MEQSPALGCLVAQGIFKRQGRRIPTANIYTCGCKKHKHKGALTGNRSASWDFRAGWFVFAQFFFQLKVVLRVHNPYGVFKIDHIV